MNESNTPIVKHIAPFLEYCEIEKGLSDQTVKNYGLFLKKFTDWLKAGKNHLLKPHELTNDHIWQYRLYLSRHITPKKGRNLKKSTQGYYLIALRALLDYFAEKDVRCLPSEKVKLPKDTKDKKVAFLTIEQLEKLLLAPDTKTVAGLRDRAILETLFSTGLRVAELVSLNRSQIDHAGIIRGRVKDQEVPVTGKGGRTRVVFFSERCLGWLSKYLSKRTDIDPALFTHLKTGHATQNSSERLSKRSVENIVKNYAKTTGLDILATPHTIRHTFATDLLNQGLDLRTIQELLGHKNIATTQIYTHVTNKKLRDIHRQFHSGKRLKNI
jgi:site-specific recombinase XerD